MRQLITAAFAGVVLLLAVTEALAALPRPMLRLVGAEQYWVGNQAWRRYELSIDNARDFHQQLFQQPAGDCTARAGGTAWVGVYDIANPSRVLYGFCPRSRRELGSIRYTLKKGGTAGGIVIVKLIDLRTNESVWSNVVNTVRSTPPVSQVGPRPVSPY